MAVKTFTTEVLTSADTNTYLANSGLVYVKSQVIGTTVATQAITSCFNGTFDAYRVVISGVTMSSSVYTVNVFAKMHDGTNPASTNYNYGIPRVDMAVGTVSAYNAALGTAGVQIGVGSGDKFGTTFDVVNPFIASHTIFNNLNVSSPSTGYSGAGSGMHQVSTAYSSLQISQSGAGTFTGGTIIVYGYRYGTT